MLDLQDICLAAVKTWGSNAQLCQLQEEAAEAIVAVNHWRRGRDGSLTEVIDELADLKIMLMQAEIIFGPQKIERAVQRKGARLAALLITEAAEA